MYETEEERHAREVAAVERERKIQEENRLNMERANQREVETYQPSQQNTENLPPNLPDTEDITALSKFVEKDIFKTLYVLMQSEKTPPAVRKSCADTLLDRGRGKPQQNVTQEITHKRADATISDVARMIKFAQRKEKEKVIDVTPKKVDTEVKQLSNKQIEE